MSKLREQFRKHGVVHLPNALDPDTLKVAERIWENTLDQPGPGASRLYRERLMFTKNLKSASELPQNGETGLFYQELGNLKVQNLMESLVVRDAITSIIHEIFDSNKAWFRYGPPLQGISRVGISTRTAEAQSMWGSSKLSRNARR